MAGQNKDWTREEHILAFNLYCKIPFGQIHMHNPRVIQLARLLKRSVGSVSLKLSNFARLDPALQARGIKGMQHGAKGEVEIWREFAEHPETLAFESERLLAARLGQPIEQVADVDTGDLPPAGREREATVRVRVNQSFFRSRILMRPQEISNHPEVVRRLAEMHQFSPEMVQKIALVLNKKLRALGEQNRRAYGGIKAVSEMLNRVEPGSVKTILETIEQDDPKLALSIRNLMFTFEDFLSVPESSMRELLSHLDKKTLAVALKGSSEDMKNHIFKTMSSRASQMLIEDMEALGPVRSREVATAQQEVVQQARKLEADGKLTLKSFGDDAYVV